MSKKKNNPSFKALLLAAKHPLLKVWFVAFLRNSSAHPIHPVAANGDQAQSEFRLFLVLFLKATPTHPEKLIKGNYLD